MANVTHHGPGRVALCNASLRHSILSDTWVWRSEITCFSKYLGGTQRVDTTLHRALGYDFILVGFREKQSLIPTWVSLRTRIMGMNYIHSCNLTWFCHPICHKHTPESNISLHYTSGIKTCTTANFPNCT